MTPARRRRIAASLGVASAAVALAFALRSYVRDFSNAASENNGCPEATPAAPAPPVRKGAPIPGGGARSLASGGNRSCAVLNDGSVRCWGSDGPGGASLALAPFELVLGSALNTADELSGGSDDFGCARLGGVVRCFEIDASGAAREFAGPEVRDFVALFTGAESACARRRDGEVWCWGRGEPFSDSGKRFEPVHLPALDGADALTLTKYELCVERKGELACVPKLKFDRLRHADALLDESTGGRPGSLAPAERARTQYSDRRQSCTRTGGGWTCVARRAPARPSPSDPVDFRPSVAPERVAEGDGAASVAVHRFGVCFVNTDGTARCHRRLPAGSLSAPVELSNAQRIALGDEHVCVVDGAGELWCWGDNRAGQVLGRTGETRLEQPRRVMSGVSAVAVGLRHTCAGKRDGHVECFGAVAAKKLDGLDEVRELAAGYEQTCALAASGTVLCWGRDAETATAVPGLEGVRALAASGYHFCALLRDGRVSCWSEPGAKPELVAGSDDSVELTVGDAHGCLRTSAGNVRCWGDNRFGQLGRDLPAERRESFGPGVCPRVYYTPVEATVLPGDVAW